MEKLKLCNVPSSLFVSDGSERDDIVKMARLLTYEASGRESSRIRTNSSKFASHFHDDMDYKRASEAHRANLMLYAAKLAANITGKTAPESYEAFVRNQRDYHSDPIFLRVLSGVVTEALRPMVPYVLSDAVGKLAQTVYVPMGQTHEINVGSGDIMIFSDSSWGASKSVPKDTLYEATFTLNPRPASATATIKWYQMVANDRDIGLWYNSLMNGMYSYIMCKFTTALNTAATNNRLTPSFLQFNSYNTANWVNAAKYVSQVNHVPIGSIYAYGDYSALAKILPNGTSQDAALTTMLGDEWNRMGYLGTVMGVRTFAIQNVLVPGTQYSTGEQVMADDVVYLSSSIGTAPVWIAFEDGTPITITLDATTGTADMSIDVNMTASVDVVAVAANKMAVISNIA